MFTIHPQVDLPGWDITCDADIAPLIGAMNAAGVTTIISCQDNNAGVGAVRRVWVEIPAADLDLLLAMLDRPGDLGIESLSNRIAPGREPRTGWEAFRDDRAWHYTADVGRYRGRLLPLCVSIRFPFTDLPEVCARLAAVTGARETEATRDVAP
jgi:hypothetical protein